MRWLSAALAAIVLLAPLAAAAQDRTCGPGAEEVSRTVVDGKTTLKCRCAEGFKLKAGRCEADPQAQMTTFKLLGVKVRGEAWFTLRDGRRINARDIMGIPIDNGVTVTTGDHSSVTMFLPDETALTVMSHGDMVIDKFLYDPSVPVRKDSYVFRLLDGVLWLVEKPILERQAADRANYESQVMRGIIKLYVGTIGVRGTDVKVSVTRGGDAVVELRSGLVDVTPEGQDQAIPVHPGQAVTLTASGKVIGPEALPK
jgi:hypothetical protein